MRKIILLIPLLLLLTGCYNYRELNDLAIISGVSVCKQDKNYYLTVEIINPKKDQDASNSKEPDTIIYTGSGESMQQAFRSIVKVSPYKLYAAQMDILIIDEETARNNIKDILDFYARDPEIRSEFYVLISKRTDNLSIISPLVNISAKNIMESLKTTNKYLSTATLVTGHKLSNDFLNPYIEIAIPTLELIGDQQIGENNINIEQTTAPSYNIISNTAIFKDGSLIGFINEEESLAHSIITNNSNIFLIKNNYKDNQYIINEIIKSKTKIKPNIDNKSLEITISGEAAIAEVNANIDIQSQKEIKKIQTKLNKNIEKLLSNSIDNIIKEYNSDIFGFNDVFYKESPKKYKKLVKELDDKFLESLTIKIKSNIKIVEKGHLNGGMYEKQKQNH